MSTLTVASWNINSVRLRIEIVLKYLADHAPDVLCLQETKSPDQEFPMKAFIAAGYKHVLIRGMKGYNGVAIVSKHPLIAREKQAFGGKDDCRHIAADINFAGERVSIHNFYVPAGGDVADPVENEKFAHKLAFLKSLHAWSIEARAENARAILVGDLNIAPFETDVWSHKALLNVVSHTPIETDALNAIVAAGDWCDAIRHLKPEPERVYSWWSYRSSDWEAANKGRRLDHIWVGAALKPHIDEAHLLKEARGWERPSDHVPIALRLKF